MGIFIQIGGLVEFLVRDFIWLGILTPVFFIVVCFAGAGGLISRQGSIHGLEPSVFLDYLASVAITRPDTRAPMPPFELVTFRKCGSRFSDRQVQDAAE
ncbi:MAG TPA: hypothetical protein VJ731_00535 [Terriglobales bacterium]|nr:hypothetical protein [Terriglobales bacterium]